MLAALLDDAAPVDLRIVGRVLVRATAVGLCAGLMAVALYYREAAWAAFLAHPKWLAVKERAGTPAPWKKVVKTILRSLPYSPDA